MRYAFACLVDMGSVDMLVVCKNQNIHFDRKIFDFEWRNLTLFFIYVTDISTHFALAHLVEMGDVNILVVCEIKLSISTEEALILSGEI